MKIFQYIIGGLLILGMTWLIVTGLKVPEPVGSVASGNEYHSTTTGAAAVGSNWDMIATLQTDQGTLGSIIITTTGTGRLTLYDATTSNAFLRQISANASTTSSSLNILANINTVSTIGTYVFDTIFTKGLLMVWEGTKALLGTSTITFKP